MKITNKKHKTILLVLVGLQVLLLGGFIYYKATGDVPSPKTNGESSFSSYLPIYVAVFIPLIAGRNKLLSGKAEKKWLLIMAILGLFVLFGILVFVYFNVA